MATFSKIILLFFPISVLAGESDSNLWETLDSLLKIIQGLATSDGLSLWLKVALMVLVIVGGVAGKIWWRLYQIRRREEQARENERRDQQRDIDENQRQNEQLERDAQNARDRIRRKNHGNN